MHGIVTVNTGYFDTIIIAIYVDSNLPDIRINASITTSLPLGGWVVLGLLNTD